MGGSDELRTNDYSVYWRSGFVYLRHEYHGAGSSERRRLQNEEYFGSTDTEQIDGDCSGRIGNSHCTEFLRNNRYGRWV